MAEFGENLKRVREDKGITQQTLADYLYVTRQAVSRWEGGSRYPDIMTAKKISQFLEVSLDELLSDDDMKLYVEKNAILDSAVSKRAQTILLALAFMCALLHSMVNLSNYYIPDELVITSGRMVESILLTLVLGYGVYASLYDKLNPRIASSIAVLFFGIAAASGVRLLLDNDIEMVSIIVLIEIIINAVFLISYVRFFQSKKTISPIPLYIMTGIYALLGIVCSFPVMAVDSYIPNEYIKDVFLLRMLSLIESLLLLFLLAMMAFVLNKKRKLVVK